MNIRELPICNKSTTIHRPGNNFIGFPSKQKRQKIKIMECIGADLSFNGQTTAEATSEKYTLPQSDHIY